MPVHCDVWAGFIFVNLAEEPPQSLREFLGPMITALDGYPFDRMTERYDFRADIGCNWKVFADAFQEYYHVPMLHPQEATPATRAQIQSWASRRPTTSSTDPIAWSAPRARPGASGRPTTSTRSRSPPAAACSGRGTSPISARTSPVSTRARSTKWAMSNFQIFPNLEILIWETGWYLVYRYWPTSHNTHRFEGTLFFAPSKTASDRAARECAVVMFKEFALQDAGTLKGTQHALESRAARDDFPLCDQEILVRHLHKSVGDWVSGLPAERARRSPCLSPSSPIVRGARALRPDVVPGDRVRALCARMASTMDEMRELYDAAFPKIGEALAYCDEFPLDDMPDEPATCSSSCTRPSWWRCASRSGTSPGSINGADARLDRDRRAAPVTERGFELSCGLPPGPDFADLAVLAEELGYARVWIFDSAPLWEDPFVHLALAAERTTPHRPRHRRARPHAAVGHDHGVGNRHHRPDLRRPLPRLLRDRVHRPLGAGPAADDARRPRRLRHRAAPAARRRDRDRRRRGGPDAPRRRLGRAPPDRGAALAQRLRPPRQRARATSRTASSGRRTRRCPRR